MKAFSAKSIDSKDPKIFLWNTQIFKDSYETTLDEKTAKLFGSKV